MRKIVAEPELTCCLEFIGGGHVCGDKAGKFGPECNVVDLSVCFPNPCQHGSTCTIGGNGKFLCECAVGWLGRVCAEKIERLITHSGKRRCFT